MKLVFISGGVLTMKGQYTILAVEVIIKLSFGRAVMMGLMLHAKGKHLIKGGNYKDALEVLTMGEVSSLLI
jgi:hypothetical protein